MLERSREGLYPQERYKRTNSEEAMQRHRKVAVWQFFGGRQGFEVSPGASGKSPMRL